MPNIKVNYENKLKAVLEYLDGNTTQTVTAKKYNVSLASFQRWIRKYIAEGADGLKSSVKTKKYSAELKYAAVLDYLSGVASQGEICKKYKISSETQLRSWILWYNGHNELKNSPSGGNKLMIKARKTTSDERIAIVKEATIRNWKSFFPIKKEKNAENKKKTKFNNFEGRNYNMQNLESMLLNSQIGGRTC